MQNTNSRQLSLIGILFFASGVAALLYQVTWQRILFAAFGSDLESVTIVVSAFMLGLGAGGLLGGWLADRWPSHRLRMFALCEAGIGVFGLISPSLLFAAGETFAALTLPIIATINFLLVLFPTLLMGATLPILIAYSTQVWLKIGTSTGNLYAINTMGAAVGSLSVGFWMFHHLTLNECVWIAAGINISISALAFIFLEDRKSS
jgi:MFS family permease